jgi:hypothetical protein
MPKARNTLATAYLALSLSASAAHAEWHEASSDHFVIYADQKEAELWRFAERLERFHAAMAVRFGLQDDKPSPSNRVTIFVVSNDREVTRLGNFDYRVAGFYRPRAGGTVAVTVKLAQSADYRLSGETVLYHEYAHHFMHGLTARAFPRWFVEGFAEFFAGVRFETNGDVGLGAPLGYRLLDLRRARAVPIRTMLTFDGGGISKRFNALHGQSWILFHYLMFEPKRAGQLARYQSLLAAGRPALEAAEGAFGDLSGLENEVERYSFRHRLDYVIYSGSALKIGAISVRALRPGEAAMMPVRMSYRVGMTEENARKLLPDARRIALMHLDDPAVQATLAEAEFNAGYDDAAIAAADRALAGDPNEIDAHIQKGNAIFRKTQEGKLPKDSWQEVRNQFVRANKVENDHPIPLIKYYLTYQGEGLKPPKVAIDGLVWAMVLAPFDPSLRWIVAQQMIADGRLNEAVQTLGPLAYSPHPGEHTDNAMRLLKEIQARIARDDKPVT